MGWVKLDDRRALNVKLRQVGLEARGLDEAAICQVSFDETDGFVAENTVKLVAEAHGCKRWRRLVTALVEVGRWTPTDGGWLINGYLEYNFSKADWEELRAKKVQAGRASGAARRQHRVEQVFNRNGEQAVEQVLNRKAEQSVEPSRPVPYIAISRLQTDTKAENTRKDDDDDEKDGNVWKVERAVNLLARRDLKKRIDELGEPGDTDAWLAAATQKRRERHTADIANLNLADLTVETLINRLEPPTMPRKRPPTPEDVTAAAAAERHRLNQLPECDTCDGGGFIPPDIGDRWARCPKCGGTGRQTA